MRQKFIILIVLIIPLIGCGPNVDKNKTQPSSKHILQITYLKLNYDQNLSEFYTIDTNCISTNEICPDKSKLLFQSLAMPNSEQKLPKGFITEYSWSPDGNKIALASGKDILVGDMNSKEWVNVTNSLEIERDPKWSSEGQFIYFISCMEDSFGQCAPQLFYFDLATKEKKKLLKSWDRFISGDYDISPDGEEIIFTVSGSLAINNLLYQAKKDGTDSHLLTTNDENENNPSFSPNGEQIVFVRSTMQHDSGSKNKTDIVLKDLVSGEEKNLTKNFDFQPFSPVFSPDGNWVLFDAFDQNLSVNVYLISIENEKIIQVTEDNKSGSPAWRQIIE